MTRCYRRVIFSLALLFGICLVLSANARASDPDYDALAERVVKVCATVQPGDVVVVSGGKHVLPLLEAIAIESQKAGGMVTIFLNSDRVVRSRWVDVPEQYLEQEPRYIAEWLKHIDVWISAPDLEDVMAVTGDVPEARFAKASKAGMFFGDLLNQFKLRGFYVGVPSRQDAELNGLDFATYERIFWAAANADYAQIAQRGIALKQLLAGAKSVRITTPHGTDLTFSIGDRPVFVADGVITPEEAKSDMLAVRWASLPGGAASVAPVEESVNGVVVVPQHRIRKDPLTGVRFAFKNGKMTDFRAEQGGKQFAETMAAHEGGKDIISSISIGLNPEFKVIEENGAGFRPFEAAGMVYLNTGDNQILGGKNRATGGFDFPITNATVTVDGKVIIRDGKLAF